MKNGPVPRVAAGFSLIELVVVLSITSLLVISITSMAMSSLLGSTRVRNLISTRQAGDSVVGQMQGSIRNAQDIVACDSENNTITITAQDGEDTTYFTEIVEDSTRIASNSGQYLTPGDKTILNFDLTCLPDDANPNFIQLKFSITNTVAGSRSLETPTIPYETSIQIRN